MTHPEMSQPLSAAMLRSARFDQARHGYNRDQVHALLAQAADRIEATDGECRSLREQLRRLNAGGQQPGGDIGEDGRMEISVRAVELLSRAQQSADNAVAEAESYARDLVATAREQYRDILQRAHETATQSTRDLPTTAGGPVPEVEYVRTYARVAQVQLRSVLEALTAEVDKLDRIPRAEAPARQPVQWQPFTPAQITAGASAPGRTG